jgi:DNA-binding NarL/FixJ family response regulator
MTIPRRAPQAPATGTSPKASVLVVEDEWITARDIEHALSDLGYRVSDTAASGVAAIDAVARERPDLALVDVRLEGAMDGVDLAAELRQRFAIPVVYLTAHSDRETVERLKHTLPYGYVSKPFDEGQLRVAVELALHKAAAERAQRREAAGDKAKLHELEARTVLLEGRLREIAGLVSDAGATQPGGIDPGLENRLRGLSRREIEIVRLLADGRRVAAISRDLDLSVHTVRNHLRAIFRKVDVHSQEELLDAVRGLPPGALTAHR